MGTARTWPWSSGVRAVCVAYCSLSRVSEGFRETRAVSVRRIFWSAALATLFAPPQREMVTRTHRLVLHAGANTFIHFYGSCSLQNMFLYGWMDVCVCSLVELRELRKFSVCL